MNDIPVKDRRRIAEVFIKAAEMFEKPFSYRSDGEKFATQFGLCHAVISAMDDRQLPRETAIYTGIIRDNRPTKCQKGFFWPTRFYFDALRTKPLPRRYDLNRAKLAKKIAAKLLA